jgi:hypothetical protein
MTYSAGSISTLTLGILAAGSLAVSCSDSTPTAPTTPVVTTTEIFTGRLDVGTTAFHAFTTAASSDAVATLASLTDEAGQILLTPVSVGFGQPLDGVCSVTSSVLARPSLAGHLTTTVTAGTYCVNVVDTGSLTVPAKYTIRVVHP